MSKSKFQGWANSLLWRDSIFFYLLFFLILIPYAIFEPTSLFPIDRVIGIGDHILVSGALISLICVAMLSGRILVDLFIGQGSDFSRIPLGTRRVIYFTCSLLFYASIVAHILIIPSIISGYSSGGFVGAREESYSGVGVPMRLYMFALPVIFCISQPSLLFKRMLAFLVLLILLRVFVLSERLAIFEFFLSAWFCAKATGYKPSFSSLFKIVVALSLVFWLVQIIRLSTIEYLDSSMLGVENVGVFQTLMTYYADVQNKLYEMMFYNYSYSFTSYDAVIRKITGAEIAIDQGRDLIFFGDLFDNKKFISGLNNPGGFSQDYSDFGVYFFMVVVYVKFTISAFFIFGAWRSLPCLALAPLFTIQILEYPRFNYLYLPFGVVLLLIASAFSLHLWVLTYRRNS